VAPSSPVLAPPSAYLPIAFIASQGTGLKNVTQNDLEYLYLTGRMPGGENLYACTRDSGSGTRNAAMNSLGFDPSWGRGDNMGTKNSSGKRRTNPYLG